MSNLLWFRVVLDEHGKQISCKTVSAAAVGSERVFYFQAVDAKQALNMAAKAYARARVADRRRRNREKGLCTECGLPPEPILVGLVLRDSELAERGALQRCDAFVGFGGDLLFRSGYYDEHKLVLRLDLRFSSIHGFFPHI
jgi:hypothetical protein